MFLDIWVIMVLSVFWLFSMVFYGGQAFRIGKRTGHDELVSMIVNRQFDRFQFILNGKRFVIEYKEMD